MITRVGLLRPYSGFIVPCEMIDAVPASVGADVPVGGTYFKSKLFCVGSPIAARTL